jgi:Lon protease-like protein
MINESIIPIFPLQLVLLPENVLPLHIFEQRYKEMIQYCLHENIEFGVVYSDGTEMRKVGCTASINNVIKKYDDGRMDIMTIGNQRFKVQDLSAAESYLQASVNYFDDEDEPETKTMVDLAQEGKRLLEELEKITFHKQNFDQIREVNLRTISFLIAGAPGITDSGKQKFLEMTLASERLQEVVKELQGVLKNAALISGLRQVIKIPDKKYGFYTN